ncbi:hypothetical protein JT609_003525 [Escherichia coli]|nr:hypothetical protein [Escherichia coli]EHC2021087.1 hypothetical protein [Escherichia coli]
MSQLAPVLPDTSALDIPAVLMPYQQRWVADTSPLKVIEKSRRTGITWAPPHSISLTHRTIRSPARFTCVMSAFWGRSHRPLRG